MKFPGLFLLLLISTTLSLLGWWVSDDAFISFRYAKHLAEGHGLVFNVGESPRVEGFTNFLWVILASLCEYFSISPATTLPLLSIFCSLIIVWRLYNIALKTLGLSRLVAFFGLLPLVLAPPWIIWTTSGLETMAFALLVFLCAELLFRSSREPLRSIWILAILLCLIRADGFAWALALGVLALLFRKERKSLFIAYFIPILFTTAAYLLFRIWYYDAWLPNTALTKVHGGVEVWERGFRYIMTYWLSFILPAILCALVIFTPLYRERRFLMAMSLVGLGFYAYSVLVGGDFMSLGRFLLPSLPLLMIGFCAFLGSLRSIFSKKSVLLIIIPVFVSILSVLPWFGIYATPQNLREQFHFRWNKGEYIDEMKHWEFMKYNTKRWAWQGKALGLFTRAGESIIVGPIGNIGYYSELTIYDMFGLTSVVDQRVIQKRRLRSPGHDVRIPPGYFLSKKPTYYTSALSLKTRMKSFYKRKHKYPRRYAPVVHRVPPDIIPGGEHYLILLRRFPSQEAVEARWKEYVEEWSR